MIDFDYYFTKKKIMKILNEEDLKTLCKLAKITTNFIDTILLKSRLNYVEIGERLI